MPTSRSILIIEDDQALCELYTDALRAESIQTSYATTGAQALEILSQQKDLGAIILDLTLPDMNGDELVHEIRKNGAHPDLKMVLISGRENLSFKAKELGVFAYLRKPMDLTALYQLTDSLF